LVIRVGGKGLSLFGGDGGISLDEGCHNTAGGFNTQRQWSDVKKQQILHLETHLF